MLQDRSKILDIVLSEPVATLLLKNYLNVQLPLSKKGHTQNQEEVLEPNQRGLGISINSYFLQRSIRALNSSELFLDCSYLYSDLADPASWPGIDGLVSHLKTDEGSFNQGISYKDGFIFGLDRNALENILGPVPGASHQLFYHHKMVGGEPRGEFFSFIYQLYGCDMKETLSQLIEPISVGSGTTSQVTEQVFGALLSGPYDNARQYRMRKTKISHTLDIGHMLSYEAHLKKPVIGLLQENGFDFADSFNLNIPLFTLTMSLLKICQKSGIVDIYTNPSDLYNIRSSVIYAENGINTGGNRIFCKLRDGQMVTISDITDDLVKSGIMELNNNGD